MGMVYLLLGLGALTTLYPFLMMFSISLKGPTDMNDHVLVPKYMTSSAELISKTRDDKYAGELEEILSNAVGADADKATIERYEQFLDDLPSTHWHAGFRTPVNHVSSRLRERWKQYLIDKYGTIDQLNSAYLEINPSFEMLAPPLEKLDQKTWAPREGTKWDDWQEFKSDLPAEFRIPIRGEWMFQEWLRVEYLNDIDEVPAEIRGEAAEFGEVRLVRDDPIFGRFIDEAVPPHFAGGLVEDLWGSDTLPILAYEASAVNDNADELRSEFALRSYKWVLGYILLNGRALWNTLIFCGLAIGVQLIVNPLAAYALSRFPMKLTAQILIFLLATMAFPAEVALIPSFLLLKNLGLLNTFAALVLPTAANGFMIFLLKGFFDSQPREVFESGQIDGAKETTMMMKLALPLSKPVLGYMALLAFMGAYGAFMYAFLVAQNREMWTLMVFIYQLQNYAPKPTVMAAVTIAALPTLVVFLMAQRVIMRGIVLPGER